jgi:CrcB protein
LGILRKSGAIIMTDVIFVAIGGFLGANCRYIIGKKLNHSTFPTGTLTINLLGAFLLGLMAGMQIKGHVYSLFGIGFMGAFTTFSTFMLEAEQLRKKQQSIKFYLYLAVTFVFGLLLSAFGIYIGKAI